MDKDTFKPTLEQAEFLFKKFPNKTLREWASEGDMSHENVRLMKKKLGLSKRGKVVPIEQADEIIAYIQEGKGTINTARTYQGYAFGKQRFLNWLDENPEYKARAEKAAHDAYDRKINPTHKRCIVTGEWLPVSEFYKDSQTMDGYSRRSKKAVKESVAKYYYSRNNLEPQVSKKTCSALPELGELPSKYFHRNRRLVSGLQQYSIAFQTPYSNYLNSDSEYERTNAHELAKKEALIYFANLGFLPKM